MLSRCIKTSKWGFSHGASDLFVESKQIPRFPIRRFHCCYNQAMYSRLKLLILTSLCAVAAVAQPSIGGIVNAASYAQAPVGNNIVAEGAIFVIFGTGMGPSTLVAPSSLPLPTSLPDANGTSVSVSSGGQKIAAYMVYSSAGQVAAIMPSNTPAGPASVTVTFNGKTSAPSKILVAKSALGVFTRNSQGNGPAIAQIARSATDVSVNALTNSAQGGDTMVIYGTGLGAISGADNVPPGVVPAGSNVSVNIAGTVIPATYAGRSPDFPGLDQINFQLPANIATGCYIPAEITASGQPSNQFYLSLGAGSKTCVHPLGLMQDALARLDAGGTANIGHFLMLRAVVSILSPEGVGGVFDTVDANGAFQLTNSILFAFGGYNYPVASGSCAVLDTLAAAPGFNVPDFSTVGGKELNAGASLALAGSVGSPYGILHTDTGGYLTVLFGTLGPGAWTVSGSGGSDVGPFSAKITLPTNLESPVATTAVAIPRDAFTITWTGGNLNAQSLVTISGTSIVINPTDPSKSRGKQFFCNAPASAGKFVVPASVMSQLPSSTVDASAGEVASANLAINTAGGAAFTAPLTVGKLDAGYLAYGEAHTVDVKFQ